MTDSRIQAIVIYSDSGAPPRISMIEPDIRVYQQVVGGYLEGVSLTAPTGEKAVMYVNEEGKLAGLAVNAVATALGHAMGLSSADVLVGNVIVVGVEGCDDADVPASVAEVALAVHRDLEILGLVAQLRDQDGR